MLREQVRSPGDWVVLAVAAGLFIAAPPAAAAQDRGSVSRTNAPGAELFQGPVRLIQITVPPAGVETLRKNPRNDVAAAVRDGTNVFAQVAVHLKGATGSFRTVDDKPSWTLDFAEATPRGGFHGFRKIHLNNSVEDPSYLNELISTELFLQAGLPAPRAGHALVELNGRPLGLYVLKEGFTRDFLALHFRNPDGNLYEPIEGGDVSDRMKRLSGLGPNDQLDLKRLARAAQEPDLDTRWKGLEEVLDVNQFCRFMAMEVLLGHRDGYCLAKNNYRVYRNADTGKFVFCPHGMDVLFGNANLTLKPHMAGLVARSIRETPEGRQRYQVELTNLFARVFSVPEITRRVDQRAEELSAGLSRAAAQDLKVQAAALKERIANRAAGIARQLSEPEKRPLRFVEGAARPRSWAKVDVPAGGRLEQTKTSDGRSVLAIKAGPVTSASWRATEKLDPGRYRLEGLARVAGIQPLSYGRNQGARLRVANQPGAASRPLTGDTDWQRLEAEFEVTAESPEAELICELRARSGAAWFDLESLRLVRLK